MKVSFEVKPALKPVSCRTMADMAQGEIALMRYGVENLYILRHYDGWVALNNVSHTWRGGDPTHPIQELEPGTQIILTARE